MNRKDKTNMLERGTGEIDWRMYCYTQCLLLIFFFTIQPHICTYISLLLFLFISKRACAFVCFLAVFFLFFLLPLSTLSCVCEVSSRHVFESNCFPIYTHQHAHTSNGFHFKTKKLRKQTNRIHLKK